MGAFSSSAFAIAAFSVAAFSFDAQDLPAQPPVVDAFPPTSMAARALLYAHGKQVLPSKAIAPTEDIDFDEVEQVLMLFAVASMSG